MELIRNRPREAVADDACHIGQVNKFHHRLLPLNMWTHLDPAIGRLLQGSRTTEDVGAGRLHVALSFD